MQSFTQHPQRDPLEPLVDEPPRPGEFSTTLRYLARRACPRCRHIDCNAVCSQCGEFKYPKRIAPFAIELDAQERQAA
jgi:hypothetical protein